MIENRNLQANSLINFKSNGYIDSQEIELSSKEFKKIKKESWLKIEQSYMNVFYIESKKNIFKAKIYCKENYLFLKKYSKLNKKYKTISGKKIFILRFNIDKKIKIDTAALFKNGATATIIKEKKEYARVEVVFDSNSIFINIKEIL